MSKYISLCLAILLLSVSFTFAQSSGAAGKDEAQIKSVVDSFAAAWNAGDMDKFSELFTPDADWVNIRGSRWTGVEAIKREHDAVHRRFYSKSRLEFVNVTVRMITPEVAVIHAKEIVSNSDVPKEARIAPESQMSLTVVKRSGKWLIANGQNTNIAPPPPR